MITRTAPLGALAYAVLEQHGDLARAAVAHALHARRLLNGCPGGRDCPVTAHVFGESDLARQHLQPGNWLAVGMIADGAGSSLVEINLTTGDMRERPASARESEPMTLAATVPPLESSWRSEATA